MKSVMKMDWVMFYLQHSEWRLVNTVLSRCLKEGGGGSLMSSQPDTLSRSENGLWRRWNTKPVFHIRNILCWHRDAQSFQLHHADMLKWHQKNSEQLPRIKITLLILPTSKWISLDPRGECKTLANEFNCNYVSSLYFITTPLIWMNCS